MIEPLDADVAIIAMRGPRRPKDVTGIAKFDLKVVGLDRHGINLLQVAHDTVLILVIQRYFPQLFVLITRKDLGYHPGVSEAKHYKNHLHGDVQYD